MSRQKKQLDAVYQIRRMGLEFELKSHKKLL
jgi:hypothetical protein